MSLRTRLTLLATGCGLAPVLTLVLVWRAVGDHGAAGPPAEAVVSAAIALLAMLWIVDLVCDRLSGTLRELRRDVDGMAVEPAEPPEAVRGAPELRELSGSIAAIWPLLESARAQRGHARQELAGRARLEELALSSGDSAREIASVARRLRTQLAGGSSAARAAVDRIDLEASRLFHFARTSSPRRARLMLNEAIEICVRALQPSLRSTGSSLTFAGDSAVNEVPVDPDLLHRLLLDLILHARAGRRVELRTRAEQGGVAISVRDDGESLPAEMLSRIFQPLARAHPRGAGLGMALSRRIALAHGGSIAASNVTPHGLEITVRLPLASQS